jgi:hypothetical protein
MIGWIARGFLIAGGIVASWFMTKDAPQFGVLQVAVATILLALIVGVLAFWPERWTQLLNRLHKPR